MVSYPETTPVSIHVKLGVGRGWHESNSEFSEDGASCQFNFTAWIRDES